MAYKAYFNHNLKVNRIGQYSLCSYNIFEDHIYFEQNFLKIFILMTRYISYYFLIFLFSYFLFLNKSYSTKFHFPPNILNLSEISLFVIFPANLFPPFSKTKSLNIYNVLNNFYKFCFLNANLLYFC